MIKKGFLIFLILIFSAVTAYAAEVAQQTTGINPVLFFFIFLIVCIVIGIFAVLAGVGGGVIFTPVMMGFTL